MCVGVGKVEIFMQGTITLKFCFTKLVNHYDACKKKDVKQMLVFADILWSYSCVGRYFVGLFLSWQIFCGVILVLAGILWSYACQKML